MNSELNRLRTFVIWPLSAAVCSTKLADNGFYYTGHSDHVVCYKCGIQLGEWAAVDDPSERHRRLSPNCPMALGNCIDNVCILPQTSTRTKAAMLVNEETQETNAARLADLVLMLNSYSSPISTHEQTTTTSSGRPDVDGLRSETARRNTFDGRPSHCRRIFHTFDHTRGIEDEHRRLSTNCSFVGKLYKKINPSMQKSPSTKVLIL